MSVREYIGARYVPVFADPVEWDATRTYEPLTIVMYQGNSYTSRQSVPADIPITDTMYWAQTGNYNAQVEQYRNEVLTFSETIVDKAFAFDNVSSMCSYDNLKAGDTCITAGFYASNDGGGGTYIIATNQTANGIDILQCANNLYAILVRASTVNALQLGFDNNGDTDNADKINAWFNANPNASIYFPNGTYNISKEITPRGSVYMESGAYFSVVTGIELECAVHINKNYRDYGSTNFIFGIPRNPVFNINVKCNRNARYGIRTDALHWADCKFTVDNPIECGVYTQYDKTIGHAENTFTVQVACDLNIRNNVTGLISSSSDEIFDNVVCINCHVGMEVRASGCEYKVVHPWVYDTTNWDGSVGVLLSEFNFSHINFYDADTVETAIKATDNALTTRFDITIDYLMAVINSNIISSDVAASFLLWDFTGISDSCRQHSTFIINSYIGNDAATSNPNIGGNGICPNNTVWNYSSDYRNILWKYRIDYCPEGMFQIVPANMVDKKNLPVNIINSASNFVLEVKNYTNGKKQQLTFRQNITVSTFTRASYLSTQPLNVEADTFIEKYERMFYMYEVNKSSWAYFTSTYIQPLYSGA